MKKLISFIKKNWYLILLAIPIIFICIENKAPDNDIWFLLNNGRYVINNGIPHIEPFTIHENLSYIMQQWLSSLTFWSLYNTFGPTSLLILIYIMTFILFFIFYKICYISSNNKIISIILVSLSFSFINQYIVLRPQIFTYLILLLEILLLELYINKDNKKYLIPLPILSLLLINFHASMWFFQFIFILPFLLNAINIKNITIKKIKIKPILITMIFMIIAGFINPYGIEAITYIMNSYGIDTISNKVSEMKQPSFSYYQFKVLFIYIFTILTISLFNKKCRLDIRHFLFLCGITILGFKHFKMYPYATIIYTYCLAYLLRNFKFKFNYNILKKKWVIALNRGIIVGTALALLVTSILSINLTIKSFDFDTGYAIKNCTEYILNNYDSEKVILYTNYNKGGYTEFMGLKSYMDPRAEVFVKKLNKKEDILDEWYGVIETKGEFDFDAFIEKYQFTHILVEPIINELFDNYLQENDEYENVYEEYFIPETKELPIAKVYVKKGIEK